MNEYSIVLKSEYGIDVRSISPVAGGWSALAYKVESEQGIFFLKVYVKAKSHTILQLEKLNLCMTVASWLESNTGLQGRINAPLMTKNGDVKVETQDHAYLLFSYIEGVTLMTTPLSICQQEELAEIVSELHRYGTDMPFDFSSIQETFEIPCAELLKMTQNPDNSLCVHQKYDMLMRAIDQAHTLAKHVESAKSPFVLCHTDIHGWNLMKSDRLILIDWESIKFAPAEADLYTFWGDWYWGDSKWGSYWDTFLPVYNRIRPEYLVKEEILRFYQMRRHIEDINDFCRQYLYDNMTEEESNEVVSCLERECTFLNTLVCKRGTMVRLL